MTADMGPTRVVVAEVLDALVNSQKALWRLETLRGYRVRSLILNVDAPETAARYDRAVSDSIEELALKLTAQLQKEAPNGRAEG